MIGVIFYFVCRKTKSNEHQLVLNVQILNKKKSQTCIEAVRASFFNKNHDNLSEPSADS